MDDLTQISPPSLLLSVIIPARNEEGSLPTCLQSILTQSEPGFALGEEWELIIVDDASTDQTPVIAASAAVTYTGVNVISPGDPAAAGMNGKNNA
jgi:glycosyltransferase involved in cell wall biosynthesis